MITKFQQGGQIEEELQYALLGYVVATKKQPKSEKEITEIAQQLVQLKQQDPKQYAQLVQLGQQAQQQQQGNARVAALGAKLAYIKKLKGDCPEGEEVYYYKNGNKMMVKGCRKCAAKAQKGTEVKKTNAVDEFKKARNEYKADMDKYKNDPAAQDSVRANKYNDQEVQASGKGSYKNGKWEPDRTKYPKVKKEACGAKMKKGK